MLKFKLWKFVACVAVLVAGAGRGEAATVSLASLLTPGATLVSGDKVFSNFHNFTETGTATPLGAANIFLSSISQANRDLADPTLRPFPLCDEPCDTEHGFRLSGDFDVTGLQNYNLGIDFTVTSLICRMYAAEMELTANATNGEVDSSMNVTKGLDTLAVLGTYLHDPLVISNRTVDRHYFGEPTSSVCVWSLEASLGLQLKGTNIAGSASAEHVDVYFAQAIPEPSTYALLLLGSAGVGLMVRRKRS